MAEEFNEDIPNEIEEQTDLLIARLDQLKRTLSYTNFQFERPVPMAMPLIPLQDVGDGADDEEQSDDDEPVLPQPASIIGRAKSAVVQLWTSASQKWNSVRLWISTNRKWIADGFWVFRKLVGWTLKICHTSMLLLLTISITSSMLWDFRILEPTFLALTDGVLTPKCITAIQQWQHALNQIIFGLDPKYPIHKFEEESIWDKFTRVFETYWA